MAQVPHELIIEILKFSPVKTLLRFRCLSKSLCVLIDSSDFINSHLTTNSNDRNHRKLIFQGTRRYDTWNPIPIHVLDIDEYDPFPPPDLLEGHLPNSLRHVRPDNNFAHCNGLVLVLDYPYDLVVWNPSTKKRKIISILPTEMPTHQCRSFVSGFGIGYDSTTDDYKILLIKENNFGDKYELWILGLRSCYWRKVKNIPDDDFGFVYRHGYSYINCFVDNVFHYLGNYDICAFDVTKEKFSRISLPTDLDYGLFTSELQVLEGCLSVSFISFIASNDKLDLYVRKKNDEVDFYWTKLFCITNDEISSITFGSEISYLGFSKEGDDEIFVLYDKYVLCTYDFKEKRTKRIVVGDQNEHNVIFCVASLVPVDYLLDYEQKKQVKRAMLLEQEALNNSVPINYWEDEKEKKERIIMEMEEQEEIWLSQCDTIEEQTYKFMEKFDSISFR